MSEQQLQEVLRLARPTWTKREVIVVQAKLKKVGIESTKDLAAAIEVEDGRSLNDRLKEAGERAFSSETLQQMEAYFQCQRGLAKINGHSDGLEDDIADPNLSSVEPDEPRNDVSAAIRKNMEFKSPMEAHLQQQYLAQQGRSKQWQQAKFAKLLEAKKAEEARVQELKDRPVKQEKHSPTMALKSPKKNGESHEPSWEVAMELGSVDEPDSKAGSAQDAYKKEANDAVKKPQVQSPEDSKSNDTTPPATGNRHPSLDDILMQLDQQDQQEQEERQRLEVLAAEEGIIPSKLERVRDLGPLLGRLSDIKKMTASRLHDEYSKRGFAAFEGMSRQDLIPLVRDAMVWEVSNSRELQMVCNEQGLQVSREQPRSELLELLASFSWEREGIPVTRLPSVSIATNVLNKIIDLDRASPRDLVSKCQRQGLPTEPFLTSVLKRNLRRVIIWEHMAVKELLRDSKAEALSVDLGPNQSEIEKRKILIQQLIASMSKDRLAAWSIPVDILGTSKAEIILERLDQLQVMGRLSLESELRRHHVTFNTGDDSPELIDRLKEVLIWKAMDLELLRYECRENRLDDSGSHADIIDRLLKRRDSMEAWTKRGVPVRQIQNFSMASPLAHDLEIMEATSRDELMKRYTDLGFPDEKALHKDELLKCLQTLLCWLEMPLETLRELVSKTVPKSDADAYTPRDALIDQLLRHERMEAWEARGYRAKLLGNTDVVAQVIAQTEFFIAMDKAAIKEYYEKTGLPFGDGTHDYLTMMKNVCIWEALPLQDLLKELEIKGISPAFPASATFVDDGHKKCYLIQALTVDFLRESYISRGLPLDTLGIAEGTVLFKSFDDYQTFNDQQVKEEFERLGIPVPENVERPDLVRFLQHMLIWIHFPISALWKTCEQKGLALNGFTLQMPEVELREQLLVRLILQWQARECRPEQEKAAFSAEGEATASGVQSAKDRHHMWHYIKLMRDAFMSERLCGIPSKPSPEECPLPGSAETWTPLEAALFVLSAGMFDPSIERREKDDSLSEPLISVVCPTSTKRQQFHPLLYTTFLRQTHEPKELVVVDTGPTPSKFFIEKAQDDPRIIYRHFIVDDAQIDPNPTRGMKSKVAWSLGLKRNIACYLANGVAIAQFDDDDLYACHYLAWMWKKLQEAAPSHEHTVDKDFPPVAMKLSEWHLLDVASSNFGYLDAESDDMIPPNHRRGWLYGWGFSYFFSRSAWERCPFPDVEFAEDAGFYEGLMVHGVPVILLRYPEDAKMTGLVAHSHHARSTSGGSGTFADGLRGFDKPMSAPSQFLPLLHMVKRVHRNLAEESGAIQPARQRARFGEDTKQNGPLPMLKKSGGGVAPALGPKHPSPLKVKDFAASRS